MEPRITIKEDYILVEPRENDYWEVVGILAELFKMPEYLTRDVIWKFHAGPLNAAYDELYQIKDFIQQYYPANAKADKKVAIVVETGLYIAMATEYVKIAGDLPPELKVFSDFSRAVDWITTQESGPG